MNRCAGVRIQGGGGGLYNFAERLQDGTLIDSEDCLQRIFHGKKFGQLGRFDKITV